MKTILFVVNQVNYNIYNRKSAIDSILCSLLEALHHQGYRIFVNDQLFDPQNVKTGHTITSLSSTKHWKKYIPSWIKRNIHDFLTIRANQKVFNQIIKHNPKPDIVFELMRYGSNIGVKLKKHYQVPLLAYFDAPSVEERRFFYPAFSVIDALANYNETHTVLQADAVVVYTEPVKQYWLKRIPKAAPQKFQIFQTLDYSRLAFVQDKVFNQTPVVGFVGSFLKWHRLDLLIQSFEKVRAKGIQAKLLLIGAGEEYQRILQMVQQSRYKSEIELPGFVDGRKLQELKNKIDIGVMSGTHWYCMPTKVFEYGAAQIPSLAPDTENMRFLFRENHEITLFQKDSLDSLTEALTQMLLSFEHIKQNGKNLQQLVQHKNNQQIALFFYDKLISSLIESHSA